MFRSEWWAWQPVTGGGSTAHYFSIFTGMDFIQQRLASLQDLRLHRGKCARASSVPQRCFTSFGRSGCTRRNQVYNNILQSGSQFFIFSEERSMVLYAVAVKEVILCKSDKVFGKDSQVVSRARGGFLKNQGNVLFWP